MTAGQSQPSGGIDPDRVALIRITRRVGGRPEEFRATGYLINSKTILTAGHVLDDASDVSVEFFGGDDGEPVRVQPSTRWSAQARFGVDIGILRVNHPKIRTTKPALIGRISRVDRKVACGTAGFPAFKLRRRSADPRGAVKFRDMVRRDGRIMTLSNHRSRTVEVLVDPPGESSPRPWEGMSGAPIFVNGYIIGVVSEHHPDDGPGTLTGTLLAELFGTVPATEMGKVCGWLDTSTELLKIINVLTLDDHELTDPPVDLSDRVLRNLRTFGCRPVSQVPPLRVNLSRSRHRLPSHEQVLGLRFDKDFVYVHFLVKLAQGFPASVILTEDRMSIYDMFGGRVAVSYTEMRGVTTEVVYHTVPNADGSRDYQVPAHKLNLAGRTIETRDDGAMKIATTISRWLD